MLKDLYDKNIEKVANPNNRELAKEYEFLSKYAINLNDAAAKGKLDPVIGRDEEIR